MPFLIRQITETMHNMQPETLVTTLGRRPDREQGAVNPPVHHASTILFKTLADLEAAEAGRYAHSTYGRYGTEGHRLLEQALAELEGGSHTLLCGSGASAVSLVLLALLQQGDHVLMVDAVYSPTRDLCQRMLRHYGVETTYYDPLITPEELQTLIRPETRILMVESPGSLTFEVQDVPGLAAAAHAQDVLVVADNTWATPLHFSPFEKGVDISVHAATKYICGHSDVMMGAVVTRNEKLHRTLFKTYKVLGPCAAPDDVYLAQRGLRTLAVRLQQHERSALQLAEWLQQQPEVLEVRHPALESCPGHAFWKRDFSGSCGLFAFSVQPVAREALAAMLDHMRLFKMGYSWGGYESLILPFDPQPIRSATEPAADRQWLRLHAGLEHVDDLLEDLQAGFARLRAYG